MKKLIVLLIYVSLFASCTAMSAAISGANYIYVYNTLPNWGYENLGVVFGQDENINDAIREMKIRAKRLGADAIVLNTQQPNSNNTAPQTNGNNNQIVQVNQTQNNNLYGASVAENAETIVQATAIRFK